MKVNLYSKHSVISKLVLINLMSLKCIILSQNTRVYSQVCFAVGKLKVSLVSRQSVYVKSYDANRSPEVFQRGQG